MSLVKKHALTQKKLAANRRNQKLSHGPATAQGRERLRAAHLRHGFYAQAEEVALRALGEEPAQFQELLEGLRERWNPADALQEGLVTRLARALWLMNRADRMQEGYALRQAKERNLGREDRLHAQMMRLKMTSASLQSLAQSVAGEHYVTTPADLELMKNLHPEGVAKEMGEMALALFYQLQGPGAPAPGEPEEGGPSEAEVRKVVAKIRQIFGLSTDPEPEADGASDPSQQQEGPQGAGAADADARASSRPQGSQPDAGATSTDGVPASSRPPGSQQDAGATSTNGAPASSRPPGRQQAAGATDAEEEGPDSDITSAEWEAREPVRQLLEHILSRQVELCEAQRNATLRESLTGPSPYERAAEIAPTQSNASLMRRMQDSNFRQVVRLTSLLMRMKRHERQREADC
jgi:hypothetical protein